MTEPALTEDALREADTSPDASPSEGRDARSAVHAGPETSTPFVTAGHELLFAPEAPGCDACGGAVADADADDSLGGHGLYVWARSNGIVYEEPPLCAACATAITITALQRWEIEEEEG